MIGCFAVRAAAIEVAPATLGTVAAFFPDWRLGAMDFSLEIEEKGRKP